MNPISSEQEPALRTQLDESRQRLDELSRELRAVDAELAELADERQQFQLLDEACGAIENLDEKGAADLFWQGLASGDAGQNHVARVRQRVATFQDRLGEIDAGRRDVLARIEREEQNEEFIADDLYELKLAEQKRRLEWVVERDMSPVPERPTVMPWSNDPEQTERLRRSLAAALLASLVLALLFPLIPLPTPDRWEVTEVPDRLTSLIREELPEPPAPVVQERLRPEQQEVEETPLLAEEGKPEPSAKEQKPKPGAGSVGILAFRDQFSSLADSGTPARLGSQARITRSGELATGRATRSLVTTDGPGSSGGIDLASLSRDVGGGGGQGIEGVQVTQATSAIGAVGDGSDRPLSGGPGSSRTDEEIQIVFDRHKAALYRLYNRALRRNPTLQGQMVLRLTIEPDGSVSFCELNSSDMKAPALATQVVERVKVFDFGAKDGIPAITILYPIDFLPAA